MDTRMPSAKGVGLGAAFQIGRFSVILISESSAEGMQPARTGPYSTAHCPSSVT
jgi:hypothetical protein